MNNERRHLTLHEGWLPSSGISSRAYGCNRETMKKHYIGKEALAVANAVFIRVQSRAAVSTSPKGQHVENPGQSGKDSQDAGQPKTDADRPA